MIRTGDPRELYSFFVETLQLPIAWPMTSPRPGVMTGGVGFGNVNVEAIQFPGRPIHGRGWSALPSNPRPWTKA